MLEAGERVMNGGYAQVQQQQSCGDSSEEELSVLPRHTKVVVTGNNRTKSVLVGLQGVVKKAVGLGGWHWLVLTNGIEVKLQRNALSVLEAPTGHEDDDEIDCETMQWNVSDLGAKNLTKETRQVRGILRNLRDQLAASDDTQSHKPPRSRTRPHKGSENKSLSRSHSCDSQSKGSISSSRGTTKVDLSKLETRALWRYWHHFKLVDATPISTKKQLIDVVQRHFMSQQLDELQVIAGFVQAAKRLKTVCN